MPIGVPIDLINNLTEEENTYIIIALRNLRKKLKQDHDTIRKADIPFNISYASFLSERLVDIEKLITKYETNRKTKRQNEFFEFKLSEQ